MKQKSIIRKNTAQQLWILLLMLLISPLTLSAQNITVNGKVSDVSGEAIIGAAISVVGLSSVGTVSDIDGNFTLSVPSGSKLAISYIGMIKQEVQVVAGTAANIILKEDTRSLEELVVIGYGHVKRKDLTGSVSSVGEDVLRNIPVTSAAQAMTGRLAGVHVVTSEGSPDAQVNIRVRGGGSITQNNSPLYIVDGFQVDNIDDVPPGDIESIDVLKDASSTAVYGAKGAYGVILITTKGNRGGPSKVTFNSSVGFNNFYGETPVLSPYEYVYLQRELDPSDNAGFFNRYGRWEDINIYKSMQGNNWQQKLFDRTGVKQNYNLSVSGSEGSLNYYISYTRDDEKYIMQTSENHRDNLNIKLIKTFNKQLKLEINPKMTYRVIDGTSVSAGSKLRDCVKYPSIGTLSSLTIDDLGNGYDIDNISNLNDPFFNIANTYKKQTKFNNSYNGALTWTIIKGLSLRAEGSYGFRFDREDDISLKNTGEANKKAGQPVANRRYWNGSSWTARSILDYKTSINNLHNFDALAGFSMESSQVNDMRINSDYYPHDYTVENILAMWNTNDSEIGKHMVYTTINEPSRTQSFFGRANYNYDGRYYLTVTARADGTNVFAPGNKWGVFPAGSGAWRVSEESFMEDTKDWLSNMKIRFGYGAAGNARVNSYWRQTYSPITNSARLYYINENDGESALTTSNTLRNKDLTWETKYSTDLGFDFGFFDNRINLTAELYNHVTKNLIMQVTLPSNTGYNNQYQNLGQTTNKGLDITLNANLINKGDFYLDANFIISFNRNKVNALYGTQKDEIHAEGNNVVELGRDNYRVIVGQSIGLMYGFIQDGYYSFDDFTFNETSRKWELNDGVVDVTGVHGSRAGDFYGPGLMKLKDISGPNGVPDGKVDLANDRVIIGNAQPKHTGGFSINAGWKGFDMAALFNWSYGNDVMNLSKLDYTSYTGSKRYQNMSDEMRLENRFTMIDPTTGLNIYNGTHANPEMLRELNANAKYWHPMANTTVMTDWLIEDGSFLRLGVLTMGYTLPKDITKKIGIKNLRVYGTATNLFCLTKYSGQDPEVSTSSGNLTPGVDYSAYPKARTLLLGVNVTF